jgi:hypothetical protein
VFGSPETRFYNFFSQHSLMFLGARHGCELAERIERSPFHFADGTRVALKAFAETRGGDFDRDFTMQPRIGGAIFANRRKDLILRGVSGWINAYARRIRS